MKKIFALLLVISLISLTLFSVVFAKSFSDVPASHWAYTYVDKLSNDGVINGYNDGTFNPSKKINRAEYIKLLVGTVISNEDAEYITKNLSSTTNWYDLYVTYASNLNLLPFSYSDEQLTSEVNRVEMAKMLVPFINYINSINQAPTDESLKESYGIADDEDATYFDQITIIDEDFETEIDDSYDFMNNFDDANLAKVEELYSDISSLSIEDKNNIYIVSSEGLITGYEDGTFRPNNTMSRAEVATVIYRLMDYKNK